MAYALRLSQCRFMLGNAYQHTVKCRMTKGLTHDLTELRYIVTLAEEKHFGKSGRATISVNNTRVAVKKLEDELEVTLFERSKVISPLPKPGCGSYVRPTGAGSGERHP